MALAVNNRPASAEDSGDQGSILESGRSPGEGMVTHSCILEAFEIHENLPLIFFSVS